MRRCSLLTRTGEPADRAAGRRVASLLAGSWRDSPPPAEVSPDELDSLTDLLVSFGAASLCWRRVRNGDACEGRGGRALREAYRYNVLNAACGEAHIQRVVAALREAGVEPILVKGWAVARLYPEKGLRPYGDIDLCVDPAQYDRAKAALASLQGLRFSVDLDHDEVGPLDHRTWEELYSRSRLVHLGDAEVRVLSPEDHLRLLCIHLVKEGARRAIWLCDIALAVESRRTDFDWELCLGSLEPQTSWVACSIALAARLLGADVSDTPVAGLVGRLPAWLEPSVLGQWGQPFRRPELPFAWQLRRPASVPRALRNRWPNPLEAMAATRSPFTDGPVLPAQLKTYLSYSRVRKLVRSLQRAPGSHDPPES